MSGCVVAYVVGDEECVPIYAPMNALCDDGNPSTKDDICDATGTCAGTPYTCNDIAPTTCTPSYIPDGVGCKAQHAPVMTPCEDNFNNTKNDVCNGAGTCGGSLYECDNEATNPCTPIFIPDGSGCAAKHAPQGTLCDDGNIITNNDVCDGSGGCMGTPYDCATRFQMLRRHSSRMSGLCASICPQGTPCMMEISTKE